MDHETALRAFLSEISEGAKFLSFEYKSSAQYTIHLRCKVENNQTKAFYNEYTKQWISKFSNFTSTNWIVRTSYPHIQRMLFRKLYFCQRSPFNKKKEQEMSKRNVGCKAKIDFKVKIMSKHTEKKDPLRRQGYNLSIFIQFVHTHNVLDLESLSYLKTYSGVDSTFCKYFREGMSPVVARNYHNLALLAQYGRNSKEVSSKAMNPTLHHVIYLHGKVKGKEAEFDVKDILLEKKHALESEGFTLDIKEGNYIIISPFMKRVFSNFDSDNLLIDTTQVNADFVTIVYVSTKIGALPIASAVHSTKNEEDLTNIFKNIKTIIEKETKKKLKLDFVMATDLDGIFDMTYAVTPRYAIISELWSDISKMPKKERHNIIELIDSMLKSETPDAEKLYEEIKHKYIEAVSIEQIDQLWYDKQFSTDIFDNFYISVRIIRQFLAAKCKPFNATIMIDVLSNILDSYWRRIVVAHCKNRDLTSAYTDLLTYDEIEIKDTKSVWFCDCTEGMKGDFCAHLITNIEETINVDLNAEDIELLLQTAGKENNSNIEIEYEVDVKDEMEYGDDEQEINQTEIEDNNYYVEVKNEDSYDPLENPEAGQTVEFLDKLKIYKKALHTLNAEFYRLNKVFRSNPNESNIDTMIRLAKELSKIQPGDNSGGYGDDSD